MWGLQLGPFTWDLGSYWLCIVTDDGYKKKIREMTNAWKQIHQMKRFAVGPMSTPEYSGWWSKRINDNIPGPSQEGV
ncbi:hypothetical protein Goklo_026648, partial [Gossypium klotzschianum]|nr:hypothetical protein [Gossypium klotzschianum]